MIVDDFKDSSGRWATEILPRAKVGCRYVTRAYSHYANMRSRTTKGTADSVRNPSYEGVTNRFTDFQEFADWCQTQVGYACGYHLDKDLLCAESKGYSKDTCVFLPPEVNTLLIKRDRDRGEFPLGVCLHKQTGKFFSQCAENSGGRQTYLGLHDTVECAFLAYKVVKEAFIKQQANKWRDQIDPRAYNALMNYEVLITD